MSYCPRPECAIDGEPAEYTSLTRVCLDCGGPLVDERPDWTDSSLGPGEESEPGDHWHRAGERQSSMSAHDDRLVRLADLTNPSMIPLVHSLLEAAGIEYFIRDERAQGLVAWGAIGTGFNPLVGPPVVFVMPEHAEEARVILAGIGDPDDLPQPGAAGEKTGIPELDDYEKPE